MTQPPINPGPHGGGFGGPGPSGSGVPPLPGPMWGAPQNPMGQTGGGGGAEPPSNFFTAMFDMTFTRSLVRRHAGVLYGLVTVLPLLYYIVMVIAAFEYDTGAGVFFLLLVGPITVILVLGFTRIWIEAARAMVQMSEDVRSRGGSV